MVHSALLTSFSILLSSSSFALLILAFSSLSAFSLSSMTKRRLELYAYVGFDAVGFDDAVEFDAVQADSQADSHCVMNN